MTADDLPQMRVEIERLADAIDKLSMRIDNHQSMTDALYVELEEVSDKSVISASSHTCNFWTCARRW